jgi:hypothetical protein
MGESLLQVQHVSILRSLEDPEIRKRIRKVLPLDLIMRQTVPVHTICFEILFNMMWYDMIWYDMMYLLTAVGLPPGGSSTGHIYTQTVHRTTQNKQYIEQHKNKQYIEQHKTIHRTTQYKQYIQQRKNKQYI